MELFDKSTERVMNKIMDIKQNITHWSFGTEFKSLHEENEKLDKEVELVINIMEMQSNLQKILNQGCSLKHPDTYIKLYNKK